MRAGGRAHHSGDKGQYSKGNHLSQILKENKNYFSLKCGLAEVNYKSENIEVVECWNG